MFGKPKKAEQGSRKFSKTLVYGTFITLVCSLGGNTAFAKMMGEKRVENCEKNLLLQNVFGTPAFLDIKNGEVKLNIRDMFTETQKRKIVDGIKQLDDVAKGINFTVSFDDEIGYRSINIKTSAKQELDSNDFVAATYFKVDNYTAKISYPISIEFNQSLLTDETNLTSIIQHELLHTLGFADLYDWKYQKSLMFYLDLNNTYSSDEIKLINQAYSKEYTGLKEERPTQINLPKTINYVDKSVAQQECELTY